MEVSHLQLVTFPQFLQNSLKLAEQITADADGQPYDLLIAINRGGAVLARCLSDFLKAPIGAFAISSYTGINQRKQLEISQALNMPLKGKRVLLIDEICDSGKTFEVAVDHIKALEPGLVKTCAMYVKPHTTFQPDFVLETTDKWVVFPYEMAETVKALAREENLKAPLNTYFKELGLEQAEIDQVWHRYAH